ncbi:MAG: nitroreductase family protein [Treponema sp.]|jgi:nitroreductase|nr:nitroreductase family protein [Treponema sp.]
MSNPVLNAIAERRSIRSYTLENLTREQVDILLKAAREAPSARNSQPWHFSVTQNRRILAEINAEVSTVLKNDVGDIFHGAPLVIFLSCDAESRWARLDCGIAVQNIALAAHSIGLGTVILGMPDPAFSGPRQVHFNELLKFPPGHSFAVAVAVGVPAGTKEAHPQEPDRISFVE